MADAAKLLDKTKLLRDMADESFDGVGQDLLEDVVAGLMDLVNENKRLAALIEWLTPKPMTDEEVVAINNAFNRLISQAEEIDQLKAEVERLTPKPMTLDRAVEVLNEHEYHESSDWVAVKCGDGQIAASGDPYDWFEDDVAIAIAEKLERERGAEDKSPLDSMMPNSATYIPQGPERETKEADRA